MRQSISLLAGFAAVLDFGVVSAMPAATSTASTGTLRSQKILTPSRPNDNPVLRVQRRHFNATRDTASSSSGSDELFALTTPAASLSDDDGCYKALFRQWGGLFSPTCTFYSTYTTVYDYIDCGGCKLHPIPMGHGPVVQCQTKVTSEIGTETETKCSPKSHTSSPTSALKEPQATADAEHVVHDKRGETQHIALDLNVNMPTHEPAPAPRRLEFAHTQPVAAYQAPPPAVYQQPPPPAFYQPPPPAPVIYQTVYVPQPPAPQVTQFAPPDVMPAGTHEQTVTAASPTSSVSYYTTIQDLYAQTLGLDSILGPVDTQALLLAFADGWHLTSSVYTPSSTSTSSSSSSSTDWPYPTPHDADPATLWGDLPYKFVDMLDAPHCYAESPDCGGPLTDAEIRQGALLPMKGHDFNPHYMADEEDDLAPEYKGFGAPPRESYQAERVREYKHRGGDFRKHKDDK